MDEILYVNSASFVDLSVSESLISDFASNIDFSRSTQVSGSFVGSLLGNATTSTTASYAIVTQTAISTSFAVSASHANTASNVTSASFSITASFATQAQNATTASYVIGQRIKAGLVSGSNSTGSNPRKFTVTFNKEFPTINYSVNVSSTDSRNWTLESQTTSSVTLNSNSKNAIVGLIHWHAIAIGEFNS